MTNTGSGCLIIFFALTLFGSPAVADDDHCEKLRDSAPEDLRMFLQAAAPSRDDPNCFTFSLKGIGGTRIYSKRFRETENCKSECFQR